jgi:hypothetical protein
MKFFRKIKDSIYNPEFYKTLPQSSMNSAVKYFLLLILVLSIIQTAILSLPTFGAVSELSNKALPKLVASYPTDLEVRIINGMASTNSKEPYFFPIKGQNNSGFKNFLVIDTIDPYSEGEFKDFSTLALLTQSTLYYQQNAGIIKSVSLSKVDNLIINQQTLNQQLNKYSPLVKFLTPLILLIIFVFLIIAYLFRLIYLLFLGLIIYLISRIMDLHLDFKQSYKVGLYAITLGLLIEILLRLLSPIVHLPMIPFLTTIASSGVFIFNFKPKSKS